MTPRPATVVLGIAAAAFGLSVAVAQTAAPPAAQPSFAPPVHSNLKVLPPETSRETLLNTMKFFSQSLGVRCTHCHVGVEGQPASFNYASDANPKKETARSMMRMLWWLNRNEMPLLTGVAPGTQITCYTCHRGAVKPVSDIPPPAAPVKEDRRRRARRG